MIKEFSELTKLDEDSKKMSIALMDNDGYIENKAFPLLKNKKLEKIGKKEKNEIYLSMSIIEYKHQMRTTFFEKENIETYKEEFSLLMNFSIDSFLIEKNDTIIQLFISFLNICFDHLDIDFIAKILYKSCSIFSWVNLSKDSLMNLFENDKEKILVKKFIALSKLNKIEKGKTIKSSSCVFLWKLIDFFLNTIEQKNNENINIELLSQILLLFIDYTSLQNTRTYFLPLLFEVHFLERTKLSIKHNEKIDENFKKIFKILKFCIFSENLEKIDEMSKKYKKLSQMQSNAYNLYPTEIGKIFTENVALTDKREDLEKIISSLSQDQLFSILSSLKLTKYPEEFYDNNLELLQEIFYSNFSRKKSVFQSILMESVYPNENCSCDTLPIHIPIKKLSLSYTNFSEYLLSLYSTYKFESTYQISNEIETEIDYMSPSFENDKFSSFEGWSIMSIPITSCEMITVKPPLIGTEINREVLYEVKFNTNGIQTEIKSKWDTLKKYALVFLVEFMSPQKQRTRGGEIMAIYDEDNNNLLTNSELKPNGFARRMIISVDPIQYKKDLEDDYMSYNANMIIRRDAKKNNFKSLLSAVKEMMVSQNKNIVPQWIKSNLLGKKKEAKEDTINQKIDLYDTFVSNEHYRKYTANTKKEDHYQWNEDKTKNLDKRNHIEFTNNQINAIIQGIKPGLTLIVGPPGTGKTDVAVQIANLLYHNYKDEKIIIITHSNAALNDIFEKIARLNIDEKYLLRLGLGSKDLASFIDYSANGRINYMLEKRKKILELFLQIANHCNIYLFEEYTCESAIKVLSNIILKNETFISLVTEKFKIDLNELLNELKELQIYELLRDQNERRNHLIKNQSKIIAMTCTYAALNRENFIKLNLKYSSLIIEESAQILEIESLIPLTICPNDLKRVVMLGDNSQLPPIIKTSMYKSQTNLDLSLFTRFLKNKIPHINLTSQGRARSEIVNLYRWRYPSLKDLPIVSEFPPENKFLKYTYQFIDIEDFDGKGEEINGDYSYCNLPEAEYAIGLYMFMCLSGYSPSSISILTTYNAQKELIKEIYSKKCTWNKLFEGIGKISTVDKYQGQQNEYVIVSLVRTKSIGYLRDIRRFIVCLSRARKGLYLLGRRDLFDKCRELAKSMQMFSSSNKLSISMNDNSKEYIEIDDFKHLYRIVQEKITAIII